MPLVFKPPPPPADQPVFDRWPARIATVGDGAVRRALPHPRRRLIGAWCFLDHFGPSPPGANLAVGPHPHIGLQTVTWLIEGTLRHRDSLGTDQLICAGQLNWMTAGRGIAHAEDGVNGPGDRTHGVQLWVALPDAARRGAPDFQHIAAPPQIDLDGACLTLLAGRMLGATCPARTHSPLLGIDAKLPDTRPRHLPLDPTFEHGVVVLDGRVNIDGQTVAPGELVYLGRGRSDLALSGDPRAHLLLLGGAPLREPVAMWWNFVFREAEELRAVIEAWNGGDTDRFPPVQGSPSPRIPSPTFPN